MKSISELEKEIRELQAQLNNQVKADKKKKGVLKEGEFYLLQIQDYDANDKLVKDSLSNVVFYMPPSGEPVCMNAYVEWYSCFVVDLIASAPYYEKWKGKKITKEEAITYL